MTSKAMRGGFRQAAAVVLVFALSVAFVLSARAGSHLPVQRKEVNSAAKPAKCTDPLPGVDVRNAPHGLFVLLFPGARVNARAATLLKVSAVCGANIYIPWRNVDQGPVANPRYDWASVDQQIGPWAAAGKVVNLIVWATGYGAKANATPDYVFSTVPSVSCPSFGHTPVFWDRGFVSSYQSFMSAVV